MQPYRRTARSWLDRWPQSRLAVLVRLLPAQCGNSNRGKAIRSRLASNEGSGGVRRAGKSCPLQGLSQGEDHARFEGSRALRDQYVAERARIWSEGRSVQSIVLRTSRPRRHVQPPATGEMFADRAQPRILKRVACEIRRFIEPPLLLPLIPDAPRCNRDIGVSLSGASSVALR